MRIQAGVSPGLTAASLVLLLAAGCTSLPQSTDLTGSGAAGSLIPGGPSPQPPAEGARETDASRASGMLRLAADFEARGENGTALPFYERAALAGNGDTSVQLQVGDAFLRLGHTIRAAEAYRIVLAKEAENGRALLGLGTALAKNGQVEEALPLLAKAAPIINTPTAYDRLGVAHVMMGHPREAVASFEQAHTLDDRDPDITTNLALAAAVAGQNDKAIDLLKRVNDQPGASAYHKRNLVLVLGIAGRGADAKASVSGLSAETIQSLLDHAKSIRAISSAKEKARALGTASSETQ
jgi:Flp pilus assembly protein TadD